MDFGYDGDDMAVGCALKIYCIVNIHKMSEKHLRKLLC